MLLLGHMPNKGFIVGLVRGYVGLGNGYICLECFFFSFLCELLRYEGHFGFLDDNGSSPNNIFEAEDHQFICHVCFGTSAVLLFVTVIQIFKSHSRSLKRKQMS